jgi:DNA-binding NarL/FixJ family response regulator
MSRVRLLVADREPTRIGIRMALRGEADVCAEAEDAEQAIRAAKREQPEVCLVGRSIIGDGIRSSPRDLPRRTRCGGGLGR